MNTSSSPDIDFRVLGVSMLAGVAAGVGSLGVYLMMQGEGSEQTEESAREDKDAIEAEKEK